MIKQKVTILLMGLMLYSPVSGLFTVICHGSDGHVAIEPAVHSHCECQETDIAVNKDSTSGVTFGLAINHDHCRDYKTFSNNIAHTGKNFRLLTQKVLAANLVTQSLSANTNSIFRFVNVQGNEFFSFYSPLKTIILLA